MISRLLLFLVFILSSVCTISAQDLFHQPRNGGPVIPPVLQEPNTDPTYKALRNVGAGESLPVKDFELKRDAGTFILNGVLVFFAPVNGRVTGAAFFGHGTFELIPPIEVEKKSLAQLTKEPALHEEFDQAFFRFSDDTYDDVKQGASSSATAVSSGDVLALARSTQNYLKKTAKYDLDGRILEDVLRGKPGGLFWAFIEGKKISRRMVFAIDPHGLSALRLAPEEVALYTYDDLKAGIWTASNRRRCKVQLPPAPV